MTLVESRRSERGAEGSPGSRPCRLDEALRVAHGPRHVELKLGLSGAGGDAAVEALGIDASVGRAHEITYFDTPGLDLGDHGIVVRVRRSLGRSADSAIALRLIGSVPVAATPVGSRSARVEMDVTPTGSVCAVVVSARLDPRRVRETLEGRWALRRLFSPAQQDLLEAHAPSGISLGRLEGLGPIDVLTSESTPPGFEQSIVADLWNHPDGSRMVELSTKCPPAAAVRVATELRGWLLARGIRPEANRLAGVRTAMEYFAARLQATANATPEHPRAPCG